MLGGARGVDVCDWCCYNHRMTNIITGKWEPHKDGIAIYCSSFGNDVELTISGDFADDDERIAYATALCAKLNVADHACLCGCGRLVCGRCGNETGERV